MFFLTARESEAPSLDDITLLSFLFVSLSDPPAPNTHTDSAPYFMDGSTRDVKCLLVTTQLDRDRARTGTYISQSPSHAQPTTYCECNFRGLDYLISQLTAD